MTRGERRFRLVLLVLEFSIFGALLIWTMTVWPRVPSHLPLGIKSYRLGLPIVPNWVVLAQLGVASALMAWTVSHTIRGPRLDLAIAGLALALFFALIPTAAILAAVYGTGQTAAMWLAGGCVTSVALLVWASQK